MAAPDIRSCPTNHRPDSLRSGNRVQMSAVYLRGISKNRIRKNAREVHALDSFRISPLSISRSVIHQTRQTVLVHSSQIPPHRKVDTPTKSPFSPSPPSAKVRDGVRRRNIHMGNPEDSRREVPGSRGARRVGGAADWHLRHLPRPFFHPPRHRVAPHHEGWA